MRRTRLFTFLIVLAISLCSSTAFSQTKEEVKQAQEHFQKGAEWFAKGEYAKAVVEFMSGHSIAPNAMFLYNVSLAYERLGNIEDALSSAEKSKQFEGMPDEVKPRNEARIVAFELMIEAENVAEDTKQAVAQKDEGDGSEDGSQGDGGEETPKTETRPDGIKVLGWSGVALAVVGAGFAAAGFATNSAINRDVEAYESAARTGDQETYDELRGQIESRQRNGQVFYAVGAAAAGVGLTLFVIDLFAGTETVPASAYLAPSSEGAQVGVTLRF